MQKFKFKFNYEDVDILKEQLMTFSTFVNAVDGVYRYLHKEDNIATITIVDEGLLVTNYVGKGWIFFSLETLLIDYYKELIIFNLTDNIPYVFEKLDTKKIYNKKEKKKKLDNLVSVRLHVLMAIESSKSLIIRRGPSKKMCTILWDREKNTFQAGDCITRIEERLADISPDGNYFYYLGWTQKGAWSAIAHTNSLRNMVFYREDGFRCADVPSSHQQYVYDLYNYFMKIRPYGDSNLNNGFPRFKTIDRKFKEEDWDICGITAVYYRRLIREGWSLVNHVVEKEDKNTCSYATYFKKALVGDYFIKKIAHDVHPAPSGTNGGHWDTHQIIHKSNGKVYDFPNWDWAEKDEKYLYWTQKGLLYRMSLNAVTTSTLKKIESNAELICDLNTFRIGSGKRKFTLDGDVDVLRGLRHEESYKNNYNAVEYHYLNSIENGGIDACFYLGQVYLNEKESLAKALIYSEKGFERAVKKEQLTYWHHEYYGHILFKNEYYKKAYKIFESSLNYTNEDKDRAVSYNYLGVLCRLTKKDKKAIKFFEKAVMLDDSIEFYKENLTYIE
jgi:tetratricopeptide (TPR) repeat protein